jgi:hypothetical protein
MTGFFTPVSGNRRLPPRPCPSAMSTRPQSIGKRLRNAASIDNHAEIQRLHALNMATESEYRMALARAIKHGAVASASYLWMAVTNAADIESEDMDDDDKVASKQSNVTLANAVLETAHVDMACNLMRSHPRLIVEVLDKIHWLKRSSGVLCELVRMNDNIDAYSSEECVRLLYHALLSVVVADDVSWQDKYAQMYEFVHVRGTHIAACHIIHLCYRIPKEAMCDASHSALSCLFLLLDAAHKATDRKIDGFTVVEHVLNVLAMYEEHVWLLDLAFDRFEIVSDPSGTYAKYAISMRKWAVAELCIERFPSNTACCNDLLPKFANLPNAWTSSMCRVFDTVLAGASPDVVTLRWSSSYVTPEFLVRILEAQYRLGYMTWFDELACSLTCEQALWLVHRNSALDTLLVKFASQIKQQTLQHTQVRNSLLAHTPLPDVLIALVVQYT